MNGEGSRPAEMSFGLAYEEIIGQYRYDHTCRRKQPCTRHGWRAGESNTCDENRNQYFAH